jgi:ribosome biogenesis GTPase A
MLWPKVENPPSGYRLAATGAIRDTAISHEEIAYFAVEFLFHYYPQLLLQRFHLSQLPNTEKEFLQQVGKMRGCLKAGGVVNLDQMAKILLSELRSGLIGHLSLETPEMIERELIELAILQKQQAEEKLARQAERLQKYKRSAF